MGRLLNTNVDNLDFKDTLIEALKDFGQDFESIRQEESDMGLGNGGLGRLAACFMDSVNCEASSMEINVPPVVSAI